MQVQNQADNSNKDFVEVLAKALESLYKKKLSEAIKRGIKNKKLQKDL